MYASELFAWWGHAPRSQLGYEARMSPTEAKATRERLVDAARDLFLRQGYTATGIAQILHAADAKSGSLYHFFPTKEDLLLAVLHWYRNHIWSDLLGPIFDRVSDPIERVFALLDGYRQILRMTEFTHGCPIGNLAIEVCESIPSARALINENFTNWQTAIQQCLDEVSGRFPDDLDTKLLATFVLTTMEGGVMLARSYRSLQPFDAAVTQLRDYFDRLVKQGSEWSVTSTRTAPQSSRRRRTT